jgi:hypothetical protein
MTERDHPRMAVVGALPAGFVVGVVNEWGSVPRQVAGEQDEAYPEPAALAARHGLDLGAAVTRMSGRAVAGLADALYPVFAAPDGQAASALNELLAGLGPQPRLGPAGERWAVPAGQRLLGGCLLTLYQELARRGDGSRLGLCGGSRCADVYLDLSPAGHRRFCSLACQNRTRVAAFRARRAGRAGRPG